MLEDDGMIGLISLRETDREKAIVKESELTEIARVDERK